MSLALDLKLRRTHTASCFLLLLQISTYNYTQEQCCRSKGLFNGRHLQWIDLIPPWLTNSNTFLACPSKYDSKFGFNRRPPPANIAIPPTTATVFACPCET
jgi:hypothetical protein